MIQTLPIAQSLLRRRIQSLQDDMEDLMEQANEIQESMNRNYAVPDDLDEADLEAGTQPFMSLFDLSLIFCAELDALGDELEFETEQAPAYLQDAHAPAAQNELPDFADELGPQIEVCSTDLEGCAGTDKRAGATKATRCRKSCLANAHCRFNLSLLASLYFICPIYTVFFRACKRHVSSKPRTLDCLIHIPLPNLAFQPFTWRLPNPRYENVLFD